MIDDKFNEDTYLHAAIRTIPSFVYSFIIIPLNMFYKFVATFLTEWGEKISNT